MDQQGQWCQGRCQCGKLHKYMWGAHSHSSDQGGVSITCKPYCKHHLCPTFSLLVQNTLPVQLPSLPQVAETVPPPGHCSRQHRAGRHGQASSMSQCHSDAPIGNHPDTNGPAIPTGCDGTPGKLLYVGVWQMGLLIAAPKNQPMFKCDIRSMHHNITYETASLARGLHSERHTETQQ